MGNDSEQLVSAWNACQVMVTAKFNDSQLTVKLKAPKRYKYRVRYLPNKWLCLQKRNIEQLIKQSNLWPWSSADDETYNQKIEVYVVGSFYIWFKRYGGQGKNTKKGKLWPKKDVIY